MSEVIDWQWRAFEDLTVDLLYRIVALRGAVFVVEQECVYLDADGLDRGAMHLIATAGEQVVAYARVLPAEAGRPGVVTVGRVVVAADYRHSGVGSELVHRALEFIDGRGRAGEAPLPVHISAQLHLEQWYAQFGFEARGESYLEDGIPHVAMVID